MDMNLLVRPMALSLVFTVVGVALFMMAVWVIVRICPFSVRKEIEDDQNIALAIIIGAVILGIALIVAAAIHGSPENSAAPDRGAASQSTLHAPREGSVTRIVMSTIT